MFLLECCPHVSPGLGKNWSQRPSQFTAAQLGYLRTSCCCPGGSLLHVPLSSHFRDMPLLPCKLSGLCFLQGKIRFTFLQACLQFSQSFSLWLLWQAHNCKNSLTSMPPLGLGKHQVLAGSQEAFCTQENLSNAVLQLPLEWVGKVKPFCFPGVTGVLSQWSSASVTIVQKGDVAQGRWPSFPMLVGDGLKCSLGLFFFPSNREL